jgi:hypothetical protein
MTTTLAWQVLTNAVGSTQKDLAFRTAFLPEGIEIRRRTSAALEAGYLQLDGIGRYQLTDMGAAYVARHLPDFAG